MKQLASRFKNFIPLMVSSVLLLGLLAGFSLQPGHAVEAATATGKADYFLKIDGISGESTDAKHPNEIELNSYAWSKDEPGLQQQGTSTGGGGGAGKVQRRDIYFTENVSKASPQLMLATATGKHFKEAVLTVRKAGKTQQEFVIIKLSDVLVSSYRSAGADQTLPTDEFSLNFAKIEFSYLPQKADGTLDVPVMGNWDFQANQAL